MNNANRLKLFAIKNLLLESELIKLEREGLELGHTATLEKDQIVDIELFESDIRNKGRKMADFYILYYCVENSVRRLISETLQDKYNINWWDIKVPDSVKLHVKQTQDSEKNTSMTFRSDDPLFYTDFGELIVILEANWADFSDSLRSLKAMKDVLSKFNQLRNVIAHSGELSDDEILRLKLLVKDWLRIQT